MEEKEIKSYSLLKIKIKDIISSEFKIEKFNEDDLKKFTVRLPNSPLFDQLKIVRGKDNQEISEIIFVEAKRNLKQQEDLTKLLREGFEYDKRKYIRFGKSPSQGKDGVTTFIQKEFFEELTERSKLGLNIDSCVISKYESYRSLIFSSCTLVDNKIPNIVIVDEYEKTLFNQEVRYAQTKHIEYIDKNTGEKKISKNQKEIKNGTTDVKLSPFDGFGVHTEEVNNLLSNTISEDNASQLFQIRLPFMKGVSINFRFREYFKEVLKQDFIIDVFGKKHMIDDVDCIWNTTMWKGYSYFKKEFGNSAWDTYMGRVNKYNYKLGISKYSHKMKDIQLYSRMNFQYLQCLDLENPKYIEKYKEKNFDYDILDEKNHGKIINMAKYSTDLIEKVVQGDKLYTLKFLGLHGDEDIEKVKGFYERAILINDDMLQDISIKKMIKRRLDKTIKMMKYGKIYVEGFYHTVVGDIIGYLEYCAYGQEKVIGCLKSGEFYAKTLPLGKIASMRSPLVDPSEVNVVNLVENEVVNEWLKHLQGQDIVMINMYDLTMQQQGGMDMDGDSVFLTDNDIVVNSKIYSPIIVDLEDKVGAKPVPYNLDSIVTYELNSRDSRIGEITNIATSILNQYTQNEKWKKINEDNIALLRLFQGKEIDFLKTGFRWHLSKHLKDYLKKLPHFLLYNYPNKLKAYNKLRKINKELPLEDRAQYNSFKSPSALNELCDYVCEWEQKRLKFSSTTKNSRKLLLNQNFELLDRNVMKAINGIYDSYTKELREYIEEEKKIATLYDKYGKELLEALNTFSDISDEEKINYCIKTAYRSMGTDKTLCWFLFGEQMIENLKTNSDEKNECVIIECKKDDEDSSNFFGRYYRLVEKE